MDNLETIKIEDLTILRDLFLVEWPLHVCTHSMIQLFIERFKKFPEWEKKVKFLSLGDWRSTGAFAMIHENRIFVNTLEDFPFESLRKILELVEFGKNAIFVNVRDNLRQVVLDSLKNQNHQVTSIVGKKAYYLPKEYLKNVNVQVPDGIELKSIDKKYAKMINDTWARKFEGSEKHIEDLLEFNQSMGAFKDGKLVAWNLRYDTGAMGIGRIDPSYAGNRYGHLVVQALAAQLINEYDADVHFEVAQGNEGADKSARNSVLQMIDTLSWISSERKDETGRAGETLSHL